MSSSSLLRCQWGGKGRDKECQTPGENQNNTLTWAVVVCGLRIVVLWVLSSSVMGSGGSGIESRARPSLRLG